MSDPLGPLRPVVQRLGRVDAWDGLQGRLYITPEGSFAHFHRVDWRGGGQKPAVGQAVIFHLTAAGVAREVRP
jgi:hypothetical protein